MCSTEKFPAFVGQLGYNARAGGEVVLDDRGLPRAAVCIAAMSEWARADIVSLGAV